MGQVHEKTIPQQKPAAAAVENCPASAVQMLRANHFHPMILDLSNPAVQI